MNVVLYCFLRIEWATFNNGEKQKKLVRLLVFVAMKMQVTSMVAWSSETFRCKVESLNGL
jgi:hypothetical protein